MPSVVMCRGLVTLASRRGEVRVDGSALRWQRADAARCDLPHWLGDQPSMAAAAMILIEECKLRLDEPVDRLLPELAGRNIGAAVYPADALPA